MVNIIMTEAQIDYVKHCIAHDVHRFYLWSQWIRIRNKVLAIDHYECQRCKERGRYKKAVLVHHINHVKNRPDLALELYYQDEHGKTRRNLISLCHDCHEMEHGYRIKGKRKKMLTEERW